MNSLNVSSHTKLEGKEKEASGIYVNSRSFVSTCYKYASMNLSQTTTDCAFPRVCPDGKQGFHWRPRAYIFKRASHSRLYIHCLLLSHFPKIEVNRGATARDIQHVHHTLHKHIYTKL